jgi:hypothetical protein
MNNESEKKQIGSHFLAELLYQHFPEGTDKNHQKNLFQDSCHHS